VADVLKSGVRAREDQPRRQLPLFHFYGNISSHFAILICICNKGITYVDGPDFCLAGTLILKTASTRHAAGRKEKLRLKNDGKVTTGELFEFGSLKTDLSSLDAAISGRMKGALF